MLSSPICTDQHRTIRALPLPVYMLGFAIFTQGTSELMLAGLLPAISRDLHASIPNAGLLISGFAIGMLIGAPVLAVLARRWSPRRSLLGFLAAFALMHAAGALAPSYTVLLVTRFAGAFVYAGFWAVATATAVELAPAQSQGRTMGVLAGGLTVATVIGLPAGTLIGQYLGWRTAFWAVAALTTTAAFGVLATVRRADRTRGATAQPALRSELHALGDWRLWSAYATTGLATAALIVTFSYLSPLLTHTTGLATGWVPAVLALYGLGALSGVTLGGRSADERPTVTLYAGIGGVIVTSIAIALAASHAAITIALVAALGFAGFVSNPTLNARPFNLVSAAPVLVAALNVSAFNVGITLGPWLGGLAIDERLGYPAVAWVGAALAVIAALTAGTALRDPARGFNKDRRLQAQPRPCKETP